MIPEDLSWVVWESSERTDELLGGQAAESLEGEDMGGWAE